MSLATYVPGPVMSDEQVERRLKEMRMYQQAHKNVDFDRRTALKVLNDLSSCKYPNYDLYGRKTLVINRAEFEKIRAKYLDNSDHDLCPDCALELDKFFEGKATDAVVKE